MKKEKHKSMHIHAILKTNDSFGILETILTTLVRVFFNFFLVFCLSYQILDKFT